MLNTRSKRSKIWLIETEQLQLLFNENHSITDILKKLGFNAYSGNNKTLIQRIECDRIDLTKFKENKQKWQKNHISNMKCNPFKERCNLSNAQLKKRLVSEWGVEYKCVECKNVGVHNNRPLVLQLDHINGISNDNRPENLRFLCPNCHSQTNTYAGKRLKIKRKCKCGADISKHSTRCRKCNAITSERSLQWPPLSEVVEMVKNTSFSSAGRTLNRSSTSIKNFLRRNGIDLKIIL